MHLLENLGVELLKDRGVVVTGLFEFLCPIFKQRSKPLHGTLDACGYLAGLLIARGFGKFGSGMRERPERVPAFHHVA